MHRLARLTFVALCLLAPRPGRAAPPIDWNDKEVHWVSYDEGIQQAADEHKPVLLVLYGEWCPHCHNYSGVFHDPRVVKASRSFVMIRVDVDKQPALANYYTPDGTYVPRTFFLSSSGSLQLDVHAPRPNFQFFYDEKSPDAVLRGMSQALAS